METTSVRRVRLKVLDPKIGEEIAAAQHRRIGGRRPEGMPG